MQAKDWPTHIDRHLATEPSFGEAAKRCWFHRAGVENKRVDTLVLLLHRRDHLRQVVSIAGIGDKAVSIGS